MEGTKHSGKYECEYCDRKFKTEEECERHEHACTERPSKVNVRGEVEAVLSISDGVRFGMGVILGAMIMSAILFLIFLFLKLIGIAILFSQIPRLIVPFIV